MNVYDLITNPPKLHVYNNKLISHWMLAYDEILYLDRQLCENMNTIETGSGVSTILFAMKGTKHTCITPDVDEVSRIEAYCNENGISHKNINFIIEKSEYALPQLENRDYDLALIDGRHAFPTPFIDWFYIAGLLRVGGIVMIDDLHIWTCDLLKKFLLSEEGWKLIDETHRAVVFTKHGDSARNKTWINQAFVLHRSRATSRLALVCYLLNLLNRREFSLFQKVVSAEIREKKLPK